jgi:signal transduction histidine kinase
LTFRNLRIIFRIGLVIGIFCFLMLVLTIGEYLFLQKINANLEQLVNRTYLKVELAQDLRFLARHKAVLIRNILLQEDLTAREYELQRIRTEEKEYDDIMSKLATLAEGAAEKAVLEKIVTGQNETKLLWDTVISYGMNGKSAEGMKLLMLEVRNRQWGWLDNLNAMVELQKESARANYSFTLTASSAVPGILVIINLLSIGIGLLLTITISRSITRPLIEFTQKVDRIAHGDLSVQVDYDKKDEIGQLGKNINRMVRLRKKNLEELERYRLHLEDLVGQRTEQLNQQREKFISVLIHDLKGPMTPILGFTRRLLQGKAKTQEDARLYLKTIESSSEQLLRTIETTSKDLREKSALDEFSPEQFDIRELTKNIVDSYIPRMDEKKITLRLNNLEKDRWHQLEPLIFKGDSRQLKTMIENLLGNAVKYASERISLELEKRDAGLLFDIADDGPGIPKKFQEKIFEQYFQVPGSQKGTGIGLYSVRKVVENHKGSIVVESEPGKGACFRVLLPCCGTGS